jgi:hypothetical protein
MKLMPDFKKNFNQRYARLDLKLRLLRRICLVGSLFLSMRKRDGRHISEERESFLKINDISFFDTPDNHHCCSIA